MVPKNKGIQTKPELVLAEGSGPREKTPSFLLMIMSVPQGSKLKFCSPTSSMEWNGLRTPGPLPLVGWRGRGLGTPTHQGRTPGVGCRLRSGTWHGCDAG